MLTSSESKNYYIEECQFKSLTNRVVYLSSNSKLLISQSIFTSCSSNSKGGNIYATSGSIAFYRICGIDFTFYGGSSNDGAFSFVKSSQGISYLNSMNESCLANGGNIDNGDSFDYRYYGKQIYKSNNNSYCKSIRDFLQFGEDSGYTLDITSSYIANTTTRGGCGIHLEGKFNIILSLIIGNKNPTNNVMFTAYNSLNFDSCIILDNQNPGTFQNSGVTMTKCKYNGDMKNVQVNDQSTSLQIFLSLLSTAGCHALIPINNLNIKTNPIGLTNKSVSNLHVLLEMFSTTE